MLSGGCRRGQGNGGRRLRVEVELDGGVFESSPGCEGIGDAEGGGITLSSSGAGSESVTQSLQAVAPGTTPLMTPKQMSKE